MLNIFIAMLLLGISHAVCFYVMTELKYSARTTVFIYAGCSYVCRCITAL